MTVMICIYYLGFFVVATQMLKLTNQKEDRWPWITAVGCFGIGMLWPLLLAIAAAAFAIACILELLDALL